MQMFVQGLGEREINSNFRTASFNIYEGGRNATGRTAVLKHIDRVRADFLTITEVGDIANIKPQLQARGYNHFYGVGGLHELYFASKKPIVYSYTFEEDVYWKGLRNPLYCEVEVNGNLIGIISYHNASWCTSNCNTSNTQLPQEPNAHDRMVQLYMTMKFCDDRKVAQPNLKGFIIQGDFNDDISHNQVATYNSAPANGVSLPAYLSYPLNNSPFPTKPLEAYNGTFALDLSTDLNGDTHTVWDSTPNANLSFQMRMDYIAYSDYIQLIGGEILNSEVDANTGLAKVGDPLSFDDSRNASDHLLVFADFKIN